MSVIHAIGSYQVADEVLGAVRRASAATGVDFGYMMAKAAQESAFDPEAQARTSSATGLYQFIDQTWLSMVKNHGAKYGLADVAQAIEPTPGGRYTVADPQTREQILDLRFDPRLNAVMAAEFAAGNQAHLEATVGGPIGSTDLYLAHFLGAGGATTFLKSMRHNPDRAAADVFPAAARANAPVFYEGGKPRSLAEVHAWIDRRMDRAMALADQVPGGGRPGEGGPFFAEVKPWGRFAGAEGPFGWAGPAAAGGARVLLPASGGPPIVVPPGSDLPGPSAHREDVVPGAASQVGDLARDLAEKRLSLWTVLTANAMPTPGATDTASAADVIDGGVLKGSEGPAPRA